VGLRHCSIVKCLAREVKVDAEEAFGAREVTENYVLQWPIWGKTTTGGTRRARTLRGAYCTPPVSSHSSRAPGGGGLCMHNASVRALFSPHRRLCAAEAPNPHQRPYRDLGLQARETHPEDHLARRPPQHQHGPRRCWGQARSRSRGRVAFVGGQAPARGAKPVRK